MKKFLLILFISFTGKTPAQTLFQDLNGAELKGNEVLAEVGNIRITANEFLYSYEFGPSFPKREIDSKETYLKFMINEKLLALEGYSENVFDNEEASGMYKEINADLATEEMFINEILPQVKITDEEIDTAVNSKLIETEIKWLYAQDKEGVIKYVKSLKEDIPFDSLFYSQINDSVYIDMRMMKTTIFDLRKKNPALSQIIDTLKAGNYSAPIHTNDGWYIVKLENVWKNMISTETELNKLNYEAKEAITKFKMDQLSGYYVDSLLRNDEPVIKRDAFNILRSYLGIYLVSKDNYNEWELDNKLETALSNLGLSKDSEYPGIDLVVGSKAKFSIDDFIKWYRSRNLYVKFDKKNLISFSQSLESLIWRMVRDRLLTSEAEKKGYFENSWVKEQSRWWKDKIAYSSLRNKFAYSIMLENKEIDLNKSDNDKELKELSDELSKKILRTVLEAKKKNPVKINKEVLDALKVSQENDKKAIDFYAVKNGGLIPRPAYPSIDKDWASWE